MSLTPPVAFVAEELRHNDDIVMLQRLSVTLSFGTDEDPHFWPHEGRGWVERFRVSPGESLDAHCSFLCLAKRCLGARIVAHGGQLRVCVFGPLTLGFFHCTTAATAAAAIAPAIAPAFTSEVPSLITPAVVPIVASIVASIVGSIFWTTIAPITSSIVTSVVTTICV